MRIKERKDCKTRKYIILIRTMENEVLRNLICDKRKDVKKLRKRQERLKVKLEDRLNIFTKEAVLEVLNEWEDSFKEKVEKEMRRKRERIGLDFKKMELEKRLKIIGKVEMNEQEKMFLALRKNVWI